VRSGFCPYINHSSHRLPPSLLIPTHSSIFGASSSLLLFFGSPSSCYLKPPLPFKQDNSISTVHRQSVHHLGLADTTTSTVRCHDKRHDHTTATCHPSPNLYNALLRSVQSRHDHCLVVLPSNRRLLLHRIQQVWIEIYSDTLKAGLEMMNDPAILPRLRPMVNTGD